MGTEHHTYSNRNNSEVFRDLTEAEDADGLDYIALGSSKSS
jgi:hypothetical protein